MAGELAHRLIDPATGFFDWWNRADREDLYQTGLGWPLLVTVVNGFGTPAPWPQDIGLSRSATLFRALRDVSNVWTAFFIKHQDDAYAELVWTRSLSGAEISDPLLEEFSSNPADEAGSCFLGLFVDTPEDMILFTYAPGAFLRISLFGRMKSAVPTALRLGPV